MPKIGDIEQLVNNIMRCNTHAVQVGEGLLDIPHNGRTYRVVVLDAEGLVSFEVYRSAPDDPEEDISAEEAERIDRAQALASQALADQDALAELVLDDDMVEAGFASALGKLPTYDKEQEKKAVDDRGVDAHDLGGEG